MVYKRIRVFITPPHIHIFFNVCGPANIFFRIKNIIKNVIFFKTFTDKNFEMISNELSAFDTNVVITIGL